MLEKEPSQKHLAIRTPTSLVTPIRVQKLDRVCWGLVYTRPQLYLKGFYRKVLTCDLVKWLSLVILGVCLYIVWQIRNVILLVLTAVVFVVILNRGG